AGVQENTPVPHTVLSNHAAPNGLQSGLPIARVAPPGTAGTATFAPGGTSITFTPNAGFSGVTTFKYFTTDSEGLTSNEAATVTVNVNGGTVWYVDADYNGANGASDGSFLRPFTTLAPLNGAADADAPGDTIFVYDNAAGTLSYSGGIALENNEILRGDGVAFTANGNVTSTTGSTSSGVSVGHSADNTAGNPTITNSAAAGVDVTLASGNTLSGITLGNTGAGGTALSRLAFGTLNGDHVVVDTNNNGINLNTGAFGAGASFTSVSVSGAGATDVSLTGVTGSVDLGTGSMAGQFAVSGGSVSTTYSGSLSQTTNAAMVNVTGGHTRTPTFRGPPHARNGTRPPFKQPDRTYQVSATT